MRFPHRHSKPTLVPVPEPRQPLPAAPFVAEPDFSDLEYEARYHQDRAALHRAKMHSTKPTSVRAARGVLERASAVADQRLRTARRVGHR